jgi:type IX secretion system PorP/SprF family membrane protein
VSIKLKYLLLSFLLITGTGFNFLYAQDLHYSQFLYSPLNLGPAEAGNMDADLRISGLHRRQWASVTLPYQTFSAGIDSKLSFFNEKLKGFGAGLQINQDKAGDGELQTLQVNLSLSYSFAINSDSVHFIHAGFVGGFTQRNLDINKLSFDNQYNGDSYVQQSPSGEVFNRTKFSYGDIGLSAGWTGVYDRTKWNAGIQFLHLNQPNQSFLNSESVKLPVLTQLHAGTAYQLNDQLTLMPAINIMLQQKYKELNFGMEARLLLNDEPVKKYAIGFGLFTRLNDAIIPVISLYWNKFRFGFSYDINYSSLTKASNGRGGPEISIIYLTKKIRTNNYHRSICPIY